MERIKVGDTVRIRSGPAAGASGIVTRISRGRAQVVNLYHGTSYSASLQDLESIGPGADPEEERPPHKNPK